MEDIIKDKVNGRDGVYLPQLKGESNPYDTLWYLSIEIGRAYIFRTRRLGTGIDDGVRSLKKAYDELYNQLEKLTEEERDFLMKDSMFSKIGFFNTDGENNRLMEMENESFSRMSYESQLVTKDFLMATLGEEDGTKEFNRRCELVKVGRRYKKDFLMSVQEYLSGDIDSNDGIKAFLDNFDYELTDEDVQLMIDVNATGHRFYNE